MTLSIILAARNRPELLRRTIEITLSNIREADTKFVIAVDDDDPETVSAAQEFEGREHIVVSVLPREDSYGGKYNRVLTIAPATVYLSMADYAPHITPAFDTKILDAAWLFPDNIGVVYNHMANLSFPQINGVTHGLVEKMGYFYPPYFPYWFVDHWIDDIAKLIGRISVADVWLDVTKRPGTHDRREVAWWATFYDAGVIHRRNLARSIIQSDDFQEPEWRKKLLLSDYHMLIEERSKMTNDSARATQWHLPPEKEDDRYRRIKSVAKGLLREWLPDLEAEQAKKVA
jgi:glycosyltransferase involved in cell wall biosynthesis